MYGSARLLPPIGSEFFRAGGTPLGVRHMTDQFIRRQNIEHFRHLLEAVTDENERRRVLRLLEEERKKQRDAGDNDILYYSANAH